MADEQITLKNGAIFAEERLNAMMSTLHEIRPEVLMQAERMGYTWDEAGLADLFALFYASSTRYCPEAKSWYVYQNGQWKKDTGNIITREKLKEFVQIMRIYASLIDDKDYIKFTAKTGDLRFRDRIIRDAETCLCISKAQFDNHPYLINCLNGTFDLETMTFREHNPEDYLTMKANIVFTIDWKNQKCDRWEKFIEQVTEDKFKADFLQRALGYSLLGKSNEECMFILYGKTTRNGKSTLLNAIETMLGDYSCVAPVELICKSASSSKSAENASPVLANLKGKRFVTMAESESSGKLDESVLKQYTGGEEITARKLYEAPTTFTPQFTLWLSCNDLPAVRDKSLFASERLRVIEFNKHFSQAEQDKNLKTEFETEDARKGIFTWLLNGYLKYLKNGLEMDDAMTKVISKYQRDNDIVLEFLESCCAQEEEGKTKAKVLYDTYKVWAKSNSYYVMTSRRFYNEIRAHKGWIEEEFTQGNTLYFYGMTIGGKDG